MSNVLTAGERAVERLLPEINANHRECMKCGNDALSHAIQAGELLAQLKEAAKHGEFLAIIEKRCDFSTRTAQSYMKLATTLPPLLKKQGKELAVDATVGGCLKLIGESQKGGKAQAVRISPPPKDEPVAESEERSPTSEAEADDPVGDACDHEWATDDSGTFCVRCKQDKPGEPEPWTPPEGVKKYADKFEPEAAESKPGELFSKLLTMMGQVMRLLDEINRAARNEKMYDEVFTSLDCANKDIHKWRDAARKARS